MVLSVAACGSKKNGSGDTDAGNNGTPDACVGLQCQIVNCGAMGQQPTTLTGTVFAPNGTLPLYGIQVYIPLTDPGTPPDTLECDRCSVTPPGNPIASTVSGEDGTFRLENVPAGDNIPLVIKSGKWQRIVTIPRVDQCVDTPLTAAETRLPKNRAEGNIPKIAITTGNADTLECLARKLGIADSEIGKAGDQSRIHLYTGNGTSSFSSGFGGTGAIPSATPFWSDANELKKYDIVILSCEGQQRGATKPQMALDAMKNYADSGGRVFASHWHNIWISGNFENSSMSQTPAVWNTIGTWNSGTNYSQTITDVIDEVSNPKGAAFANWMLNVMGSTVRGELAVDEARTTSVTLDTTRAERWVYTKGNTSNPVVPAGRAQMFQFTTPNEVATDQRCGKVVFTDMHVSGTPQGNPIPAYPNNCAGGPTNLMLTAQEKALAFMFFDIASCVGGIL
ncbi:MAG TPA: hypothetical protein VK427_17255 [Kofleriaceae bacterium]|nr:hypothetical protein [Kofleriaceae bacterium]